SSSSCNSLLPPFPTRRSSDLAPQVRIALAHDDSLAVLASHLGGRPVQDGYTAFLHTFQQRGMQLGVRYRAAQPLYLEVAALNQRDRKSTRLNSSHVKISYAVF